MTTNKLPEWRKSLNEAVENYQSTRAWYEENQDSPSAEQDMDAAAGAIEELIKQYGVLIVLNLLDEIDELQERRKADSAEPIYQLFDAGWYDTNKGTYDDVTSAGMKGRIVYAAPQPLTDAERAELQERRKPVITFYSEGIAAAANWVDQQRESYDNEHGRRDNDTGSFEFGNDAQRDYSDTLAEIAEGIRALHPSTSEQERRKAGDICDLFLRAKQLMYQSGGAPIENSLNPIDAWLYDAEHAATQSTPLAKGGDNAQ
ncbi:hypothetical protein [Kluyvera georgiana]|uniref:hypothetical protein n=1 Tax=Kluyvera georgiana TaxID=73098 RepID=UPI003F672148